MEQNRIDALGAFIAANTVPAPAQAPDTPVAPGEKCEACDGKGGWATASWTDPVSGPECEGERCGDCEGTGRVSTPLPAAPAPSELAEQAPHGSFEKWALTSDGNCSQQDLRKDPSGSYLVPEVARDFEVWNAARQAPDASLAQGAGSVDALTEMEARKDAAYLERNQVVAALAKLFPSGTTATNIPGWDEHWHGCVRIDLPTGQVSWHYHDDHAYLFADLPPYTGEWDGHDTPEKYRRLASLVGTAAGSKADASEACATCHGEGIDGEPSDGIEPDRTWTCTACNGTGKARARLARTAAPSVDPICPQCKGSGEEPGAAGYQCPKCDGLGSIEAARTAAPSDRDMRVLADLILTDPAGGQMVISSDISTEHDYSMRFTVTNPDTGHRFGVVLGLAELASAFTQSAPAPSDMVLKPGVTMGSGWPEECALNFECAKGGCCEGCPYASLGTLAQRPAPSEGQAIPTDLSKRLRSVVADLDERVSISRALVIDAADEIDRLSTALKG